MPASSNSNDNHKRVESYIGSFLSLISKSDIRYEGVLSHLSVSDSTLALSNVRSYGSEGRKKDGPQIPPSDVLYEYILFRGTDIKDLQVKPMLSVPREEHVHTDPAIIQSQFAGVPAGNSISPSFGIKNFTEPAQGLNTPALASGVYPLPTYPSSNDGGTGLSQATQNAGPSFSTPSYWQGLDGTSSSRSFTLQHSSMVSPPLPVQNQMQLLGVEDTPVLGPTNSSEFVSHMPPAASDPIQPNFQYLTNPVQFSTSQGSFQSPNMLTTLSIPFSTQETNIIIPQSISKGVFNPPIMQPTQILPYPLSSHDVSFTSPFLTPSPSLLSPQQSAHFIPDVFPSTQKVLPDQNDVSTPTSMSSTSLHWNSGQATQPPLLPLPNSSNQFTEEFDFEAMNEKFKKDEVWDCLGKAKQLTKGTDENPNDRSWGDKEFGGLVSTIDAKPAYNKDNFFDNISCNSLNRGGNGQNRFAERMKHDTETFGIFRQNPNLSYGGFGTGRGNNYHRGHSWGRGYGRGHGGRGRGNITF